MTPNERAVLGLAVKAARQAYFVALDQLVPDGVTSLEWLPIVGNWTGEIEGYRDWISDTWQSDPNQGGELAARSRVTETRSAQ